MSWSANKIVKQEIFWFQFRQLSLEKFILFIIMAMMKKRYMYTIICKLDSQTEEMHIFFQLSCQLQLHPVYLYMLDKQVKRKGVKMETENS